LFVPQISFFKNHAEMRDYKARAVGIDQVWDVVDHLNTRIETLEAIVRGYGGEPPVAGPMLKRQRPNPGFGISNVVQTS
jgi:hypothetical protein